MRLDQALVARGMVSNRSKARDAVLQGIVTVNGAAASKPGQLVNPDATIQLSEPVSPYVSRAGLKLAHALNHFSIDPSRCNALDVGASTGGFTDVLLQRGAAHVTAIDVGHGQLDDRFRRNPRVSVHERLNCRDLAAQHLKTRPDLIVCDVSFISLKVALPAALALSAPDATLIALIKPQFEVGRKALGKGGIVRDPSLHKSACDAICAWIEDQPDWRVAGLTPSPVEGSDGNLEFLVCAQKP